MQLRLERRLSQPRWLTVAVPIGSLLAAFVIAGLVLLITGHNPFSTYRKLFNAAFVQQGSLTQTLVTATPLIFTGLAAAAAFRMRLFNIGAEGQLYLGATTAAAAGLWLGGSGGPSSWVIGADGRRRMRGRRLLGADPGRPAGVLQDERDHHLADAQLRGRLPDHVPDLREPLLLARVEGLQRERLPDAEDAARQRGLADVDDRRCRAES